MDGEKSLIIKKKKSSTLVLGTIQIYQRPKKKKKHNTVFRDMVGWSTTEVECKSHMDFKIFIATLIKRKMKLILINFNPLYAEYYYFNR